MENPINELVRELLEEFDKAPLQYKRAIGTPRFRVAYGNIKQLLAEETGAKEQAQITTLYQARNKVFCVTYWTKQAAEEFVSKQPPSTGFRVQPLEVFGDRAE